MRHVLIAIATFLLSSSSFAGGSGGGHSVAGYVFFTYAVGGYISFKDQRDSVHLQHLCDAGGTLWAFGRKNTYKCTEFRRYDHQGGDNVITIGGSTKKEREEQPTVLFSTKPFQEQQWKSRALIPQEITTLIGKLESGGKKFKAYVTTTSKGKAKAVGVAGNEAILYVIPGQFIKSEFASTHKHLVALLRDGTLFIRGELGAAPRAYTDVNGDGVPEILLSLDCDGNCWQLLDVSEQIELLAEMSDH